MKTISGNIFENIKRQQSINQTLNEEQLMGFKTESEHDKKVNRCANNNYYGIMVQIKILTILPELIWSKIEEDDFFVATQLFIFSRHISTGLKLEANNEIMKKYQVAKKQWDLLSPFYFTIKQQCLQTLERENLTSQVAAKCLASLLLLENCQLEKLLSTFIQTRSKTFQNIIQNEDYGVVKDKLLNSVKILIHTVTIIHDCFIGLDNKDGLLMEQLKLISSESSAPTLALLNTENSPIFKTLPDIIAKYKPQVFFSPLKKEALESSINGWLISIENVSQNQLKSLVQQIVSIKTVQDIHRQINKIEKSKHWPLICRDLSLPENIDFYKRFYHTLINERIQSIITISWSSILADLDGEVEKLIAEIDRVHRDMKYYVWVEDPLDNPLSLKDALSPSKQSHRLLMKVKGISTSIVELCNKIDGQLELLFNDLKLYLGCESDELRRAKDIDPDHLKIITFLRECSRNSISALITSIKSSSFGKNAENCIMLARLLNAISELCPNLKLCFSGHLILEPSFLRDPTKDDDGDKEWNSICGLLQEESLRFWSMWLDIFVSEWKSLDKKMDLIMMLKDFPCWDTITIEEKDESDNVVESVIHVPSQLSLSIQSWIFDIITNLNRIIPHTLPRPIHLKVVDHVINRLYDHYEIMSIEDFVNSNQKVAWQFFLDLKVLMMLFVGRDNKIMNEKYQQLVNHFKSIIDPFDFDVFYQYVNGNIKRNAARLYQGMGCLVPNTEYLAGILANHTFSSPHDKDPNILTMSTNDANIEWFPLLPIITTNEIVVQPVPEIEKKKVSDVNGLVSQLKLNLAHFHKWQIIFKIS